MHTQKKIPIERIYSTRHHKGCVDTFPSAAGIPSSWAACSALPALVAHAVISHAQPFKNPSAQLVQNCQYNVHSHLNPDHVN